MPTLDWLGKTAVIKHHEEVPFHLLRPTRTVGAAESGNLLVQGDNLLALKALLPHYGGQVKCIYIDPPYNTGNENWLYNDAVNSPEMRAWLGKTVGREDLSRHDKWLCMMYPRLLLLRQFLREDGSLWVSLDDNEVHHARAILDEIFGEQNFIATVIWQKMHSPKNSAKHLSVDHDYILIYANKSDAWKPNLTKRTEKQDERYSNPDNDPRGPWTKSDLSARNYYSLGTYEITTPSGRVVSGPPKGRYWTVSKENFDKLVEDKRIWWGKDGNAIPMRKRFLSEVKDGVVPQTLWFFNDVGNTRDAKQEIVKLLPDVLDVFTTPKPTRLIEHILQIATDKDDLVMDSFAGSGTTGHAVLQLNQQDGGNRRFILVEMEPHIAQNITATRLQRVIEGYTVTNDKGQQRYEHGLGGGLQCYELGETLFTPQGRIQESVTFEQLARHVFFSETRQPLPPITEKSPLLGAVNDQAVYLLYNGILQDKSPQGGNALTQATLQQLPPHDGAKVIYGSSCRLSAAKLQELNITFRQIPYQVTIR